MKTFRNAFGLLACVALATGWTACSNTVVTEEPEPDPAKTEAELMRRATSCEDLEEALKADARARLQLLMQQQDISEDGWVR